MEGPIIDTFSHHYPPDLLAVLVDTIPRLVKSKKLLISFFRSAGVSTSILEPYESLISRDRTSVRMYDIARDILVAINEQGDKALPVRRKLLQAVYDFEDFDTCCYENRRNEARGFVWKVREIVNRKDAFTRMNMEREQEKLKNLREKDAALAKIKMKKESIKKIQTDLSSLITSKDPHKRGKALEKVLNELFDCYGIKVRDSFVITGVNSEGIVEQIDGVIQFEGTYYLVEMKWWKSSIGKSEINDHIARMSERGGQVRGLYISFSNYSEPSITACRSAFNRGDYVILAKLEEIFRLLDTEYDLNKWLKAKIEAALLDKNPLMIVDM